MQAIHMSRDMEELYQSVARATGRSLEELVQEALDQFLVAWEDQQDALDAERLAREFRESGEEGTPFDEVLREAGMTRADLV